MLYKRLVAKFGTNLLTASTERLNLGVMASLVEQIVQLHQKGHEVIIVSSGAIAAGRHKLKISKDRRDIPFRQVLASVGQSQIMNAYDQLFGWHDITVAQALLTKAALSDRVGYLNSRNTFLALLELGVVCIVNENDVVAIDEIEGANFGDNDNLSAMVANLIDADLLLLLTNLDGLYTADPHKDPSAQLISRVDKIDNRIRHLAGESDSQRGTGGMVTKIEAANLATTSGTAVVIANGQEPGVILRVVSGDALGTLFPSQTSKRESRKRWLLSGLSARGRLVVDGGAVSALRQNNKSLLAAGIIAIEDCFQRGDTVNITDTQGNHIACGITNYSSSDLTIIQGSQSDKITTLLGYEYGAEVVHRNNMVIL